MFCADFHGDIAIMSQSIFVPKQRRKNINQKAIIIDVYPLKNGKDTKIFFNKPF